MDPEIAGHSRFLSKDCQSLVRVPTNHGGMSLLLQAVNAGNTNMVKCMINKGVNLDERDRNQHYCLHYAIWRKNLEMVKILLESEVCVNYEHPRNYCPLKTAVAEGDLAIVKLLIDAGANVNSSCGREHPTALTALHIAVQLQPAETRLAMVKLLLAHGANVNAPDKLKSSVLSTAIRYRFLNVIEILVLHGAKGDIAKNGLQHTAFQCAILNGNEAVVRIFLEKNLDLDLGSKRLLPLHLALRNSDKGVIKALLDSGRFRIDKGDDFGVTALHRSVKNQSLKDIKILLKKGARVSTVNYRDESPLYSAIMIDSDDIVDLLLGRNKDPRVKTILFHNALKICYLLSERNQSRIAKSFIREIALYRNSDQILNGIEMLIFVIRSHSMNS
ncbi:hypothetical protein QAD02_004325 [Eretmocerus hayati]|uniref:Uncharacterized protein n=1 Tax=Eretmocerus hayati TaxID=131215 RepID=A0ACC2NPP0_9HYME|nr:hypothetical protein QAD02_004325 [Eretmocerus hayati]